MKRPGDAQSRRRSLIGRGLGIGLLLGAGVLMGPSLVKPGASPGVMGLVADGSPNNSQGTGAGYLATAVDKSWYLFIQVEGEKGSIDMAVYDAKDRQLAINHGAVSLTKGEMQVAGISNNAWFASGCNCAYQLGSSRLTVTGIREGDSWQVNLVPASVEQYTAGIQELNSAQEQAGKGNPIGDGGALATRKQVTVTNEGVVCHAVSATGQTLTSAAEGSCIPGNQESSFARSGAFWTWVDLDGNSRVWACDELTFMALSSC